MNTFNPASQLKWGQSPSLSEAVDASWSEADVESARTLDGLKDRLEKGAFNYVLVAQRFTASMEKAIEYLNAIAAPSRFFAVEMVRFMGDGVSAFEARTVVKQTRLQASSTAASVVNEERFLEDLSDENYKQGLRQFFDYCRSLDLRFEWGTKGTSIRLKTPDRTEPLTIAWVFPAGGIGWMGLSNVSLGIDESSAQQVPSVRAPLGEYLECISAIPGARQVTGKTLKVWTFEPNHFLGRQGSIRDCIAQLVQKVEQ